MILDKNGNPITSSIHQSPKLVGQSIYNPPSRSHQTDNYKPYYPTNPNWNMSFAHKQGQQKTTGLYFENAIASGIVDSMVDGTIGGGLSLESNINYEVLGLKATDVKPVQKKIESYWKIWANSPVMCHFQNKLNFGSLQREAYRNALSAGDMLQNIKIVRPFGSKGEGYAYPTLLNIAGQSIMSPNNNDTEYISGGIECDKNGREVAYHIATGGNGYFNWKTDRVTRYGSRTSRLQYNFVAFGDVIPGQKRGRSVLLRVANQLIQIDRFSEAEIVKAVIQSNITLFLETEKNTDNSGANDPMQNLRENSAIWDSSSEEATTAVQTDDGNQVNMGPGFIWDLPVGKTANLAESKSPVTQFWKFLEAQLKIVSMGVGIPYEVLLKCFNSNYSASQAAIISAARGWKIATDEFAYKYNQPVYEQFVEMLVRQGIIKCNGFFKDPIARIAWCSSLWQGPAMLNIDPVKNVKASIALVEAGFSTREIESKRLCDNKFDAVAQKLSEENQTMRDLDLPVYTSKAMAGLLSTDDEEEEGPKGSDDDDKEKTEDGEDPKDSDNEESSK
jgi:lambda family phage portal protein